MGYCWYWPLHRLIWKKGDGSWCDRIVFLENWLLLPVELKVNRKGITGPGQSEEKK